MKEHQSLKYCTRNMPGSQRLCVALASTCWATSTFTPSWLSSPAPMSFYPLPLTPKQRERSSWSFGPTKFLYQPQLKIGFRWQLRAQKQGGNQVWSLTHFFYFRLAFYKQTRQALALYTTVDLKF